MNYFLPFHQSFSFHGLSNKLLLIMVLSLCYAKGYTQLINASNYPMTTYSNVPLEDMAGATTLFGPGNDNYQFASVKIGNNFNFCLTGTCCDSVLIGVNSKVKPGAYAVLPYDCITPMSFLGVGTGSNGFVKYKLAGTYPHRRFIIHWKVTNVYPLSTTAAPYEFQVVLHESGRVDFNYGNMPTTWFSNYYLTQIPYNIESLYNNARIFVDINNPFLTSVVSYDTYVSNSTPIPFQSKLSFIPDSTKTNAPLVSISASANCTQLLITDTTRNEIFFKVLKSADGIHYDFWKLILTNTLDSGQVYLLNDTSLQFSTTYYYAVTNQNFATVPEDTVYVSATTTNAQLSGIKTIPGDYNSITEAISDIKCRRLSDDIILELSNSYTTNYETFPLQINDLLFLDSSKTLTIRPALGASNVLINNNGPNALLRIQNVSYVTIDGRPGGVGVNNELTLQNDTGSNNVFYLGKYTQHTLIRNCNIKGKGQADNFENCLIYFDSLNVSSNTIVNCNFSPVNSSEWLENVIVSKGSNFYPNINNLITACNFQNFGNYLSNYAYNIAAALKLENGNAEWTIENNSFYATDTINSLGYNFCVLIKNTALAANFNVKENWFGGTGPQCQGGIMETYTSIYGCFNFISLNLNKGNAEIIGNQMKKINFNMTNPNFYNSPQGYTDIQSFISVNTSKSKIHNNIIGDSLNSNCIKLSTFNNNTLRNHAIISSKYQDYVMDTAAFNTSIKGNMIAGVKYENSLWQSTVIAVQGSYLNDSIEVKNNIINTISGSNYLKGLEVLAAIENDKISITNNNISNISSNSFNGIYFSISNYSLPTDSVPSKIVINNNNIHHIEALNGATAIFTKTTLFFDSGGDLGDVFICNNHIYAINSPLGTNTGIAHGQSYQALLRANNYISGNFIHHLASGNNKDVIGIILYALGKSINVENNMISLGLTPDGNYLPKNSEAYGLKVNSDAKITNNSIYIKGNPDTLATFSSFCISGTNHSTWSTVNTSMLKNNILSNSRFGDYPNTSNAIIERIELGFRNSDYNQYYDHGFNKELIHYVWTFYYFSLQNIQQDSGWDIHSFYAPPMFVNPDGDAFTCDMHLQPANYAESRGTPVGLDIDFDNDNRLLLSPVDLGADAGNFYAMPVANLGLDTAICSNDAVILDPGNYSSYQWNTGSTSPTISVDTAGVYVVSITDSLGYTSTDSIEVVVNPNPVAGITGSLSFCAGQSTTLTGSGGSSYLWQPSLETTNTSNVSTSGNISLTVTDNNNCVDEISVNVIENALPIIAINALDSICLGDSIVLSAIGLADSYVWNTGDTTQNLTDYPISNQLYAVTATSNGCSVSVNHQLAVLPCVTALAEAAYSDDDLIIFPAPSSGEINIAYFQKNVSDILLKISDANGRLIYKNQQYNFNGTLNTTLNLENEAKGIYYLQIFNSQGVITRKIVLQ
jgi:hypothetical protein